MLSRRRKPTRHRVGKPQRTISVLVGDRFIRILSTRLERLASQAAGRVEPLRYPSATRVCADGFREERIGFSEATG